MFKGVFYTLIGILLLNFMVFTDVGESAEKTIKLKVNDKQISATYETIIKDERIYIPIRVVAEELGAQVIWDTKEYTVVVSQNQGDRYLKGLHLSEDSGKGIATNLIKAADLKDILDDDQDNDLADYREGHNGGDLLANDPLVVDLRETEDYDAAHIPSAIWIAKAEDIAEPQNVQELKSRLEKHVENGGKNEIVVYCSSGNMSGLASGFLGAYGLPVKNLMYGFDIAWRGTSMVSPIFAPMEDGDGQKHLCGG